MLWWLLLQSVLRNVLESYKSEKSYVINLTIE